MSSNAPAPATPDASQSQPQPQPTDPAPAPAPAPEVSSHSTALATLLALLHTPGTMPAQLLTTLKALPARDAVLAAPPPAGAEDALRPGVLDVAREDGAGGVGGLFILSARLSGGSTQEVPLEWIEEFCRRVSPVQLRFAPERVTLLAKGIVQYAEARNNLKIAIPSLYDLITRFPPTRSLLTPLHPIFLTTCLTTSHFAPALPILAVPITQITPALTPDLTYLDHLVYHYTGGCVLAALRRFAEAHEFWETVVGAPVAPRGLVAGGAGAGVGGAGGAGAGAGPRVESTGEPSALQMEAAKKLLVVQLILHGKGQALPKYTPAAVAGVRSSPYGAFVKAYPRQVDVLRNVLSKHGAVFAADNNTGLLKQALARAPRWAIKKLTETYLTLGLGEIGREVGMEDVGEVRRVVLSMIEHGEINASIAADGTVTFADDAPPAVGKAEVERVLRAAQEQEHVLRELEREMARSREYLAKAVRSREDPAAWAGPEEEMGGAQGGVGMWTEESVF
ncbi:hypothetical protein DENSPDRAFT_882156 [Dentipellis sp. KUC8613]|nr:hypothetical protein DENSPDRAFT_882156 [Dentipellis sp. KUC8613]